MLGAGIKVSAAEGACGWSERRLVPSVKHPWDLRNLNYLTDFILIAHWNDDILDMLY